MSIRHFLVFSCLFLVINSYSQDFYILNFAGDQTTSVTARNIIMSGPNRYILYEKGDNNFGHPDIGIAKIDVASNQILFDYRCELDPNLLYAKAIDLEVAGDKLYVLVSINFADILLLTVDASTGALIQKEKITPATSETYSDFAPMDLLIGYSGDEPYCVLLGSFSFANNPSPTFSKMVVLYKKFSQLTYKQLDFYAPNNYSHLYDDAKIDFFRFDPWGQDHYLKITGRDAYVKGGFSFVVDLATETVTESNQYSINDNYFRFFRSFYYDGQTVYYGQLLGTVSSGEYTVGQSGDLFKIVKGNSSNPDLYTYSNPNIIAFAGDRHSNETGGESANVVGGASFGGLYIDPLDVKNPLYCVGTTGINPQSPLTAFTYSLRNFGGDYYDQGNHYWGFEYSQPPHINFATTYNSLTPEITGVFSRKSDGLYDRSNLYYMKQRNGGSCNGIINFTQTYDKSLSIIPFPLAKMGSHTVTASDYAFSYNSFIPGPTSPVCLEPLTNSVPPPPQTLPCDPNNPCWEVLPLSQSTKKSGIRTPIEGSNAFDVNISPNPIINEIIITSEKPIRAVLVYDVSGKTIANKNNLNQKQITMKMENIKSGTYFAKVAKADGTVATKKMIKL